MEFNEIYESSSKIFDEACKKVLDRYDQMSEVEYLEEVKQYVIDEGLPYEYLEQIQQELMEAKFEEFKDALKKKSGLFANRVNG